MSSLDLSGLDKFSALLKDPKAPTAADGRPLELALDAIDEDPGQPRKHFDEAALTELAKSIRARGVKTPISVRPAIQEGRYIINHGTRRYRASALAGVDTIPAFIDSDHSNIDQLAENIQREALSTREIIDGIGQLLAAGKKQAAIAKELGKSPAWVSKFAKLQNLPDDLAEAVATSRCKDSDALVILLQCREQDADATRKLLNGDGIITKLDAERLRAKLQHATRGDAPSGSEAFVAPAGENLAPGNGDGASSESQIGPTDEDTESKASGRQNSIDVIPKVQDLNLQEGRGNDREVEVSAETKPAKNRKPRIQVKVGRREGVLLLSKPSAYGLAWVKYEDSSEEEVNANRVKLVAVVDAKTG